MSIPGVYNIKDLENEGIEIEIELATQTTGWKINKTSLRVDDPSILRIYLTKPPVNKIDLCTPLETTITVKNSRGVTVKDALDAIHKAYKHTPDEDLEEPYLAGFEWDKEESWTQLVVRLRTTRF